MKRQLFPLIPIEDVNRFKELCCIVVFIYFQKNVHCSFSQTFVKLVSIVPFVWDYFQLWINTHLELHSIFTHQDMYVWLFQNKQQRLCWWSCHPVEQRGSLLCFDAQRNKTDETILVVYCTI